MSLSPADLAVLRTLPKINQQLDELNRNLRALAGPARIDAPAIAFQGKTVVFPNKQDNVSNKFQVGIGQTLFNFKSGEIRYPQTSDNKEVTAGLEKLAVIRSAYIFVDQPASVGLPGIGNFDLKAEDTMTFERLEMHNIVIATTRSSTAIRIVASEEPVLPVELVRSVSSRRIAGFDGSKISAQALDSALTVTFAPQKAFAALEVGLKFTAAYTGTFTVTKVSRYGTAFNVRRLVASLAAANDTYWAPEPEFDFQKGDNLQLDLTAQASCVVSGEAVTDDR